ncbi:hypothetical protein G6F63_015254 [Rhizopus arrhizus]|nr:hypothetical protein G6F63_015254 [Rhizopus arrhizus]
MICSTAAGRFRRLALGSQLCGHHQRNDQQWEAAQQQYQRAAQVPPQRGVTQAFEARTVVGIGRHVLVEDLADAMEAGVGGAGQAGHGQGDRGEHQQGDRLQQHQQGQQAHLRRLQLAAEQLRRRSRCRPRSH